MIQSSFCLTDEERRDPAIPVIQDVPDIEPQQPQPPGVVLPPWLPIVVPESLQEASRQENKTREDRPPKTAFRGGRWLADTKKRCPLCHNKSTYTGRNV